MPVHHKFTLEQTKWWPTTHPQRSGYMRDMCMSKDCSRPASIYRGLCLVCYGHAKDLVERGDSTWEELVELGLAQKSNADNLFTTAFNEAKESRDAAATARDSQPDVEGR